MMQREVTPRVAGLIQAALSLVDQALYEGDHAQRQEPEPREGSPWDRPDAPAEFLRAITQTRYVLMASLDNHFSGAPRAIHWEEIE